MGRAELGYVRFRTFVGRIADIKCIVINGYMVHGGAGGVGSACVQVAHALGATVYATARASRLADVGSIGAAAVIDYRADDFESVVARLTDRRGANAVIDFVGGDYLPRNLRSLRPGGTLVAVEWGMMPLCRCFARQVKSPSHFANDGLRKSLISQRPATVHGVVFDFLVGRSQKRAAKMT